MIKKKFLVLLSVGLFTLALTNCRETEREKMEDDIENAAEEVESEVEKTAEEVEVEVEAEGEGSN